MNKPGLKEEKLWILGSVIVGFAASFYLYFRCDATSVEIFELGFAFSFLLWFVTVIRRGLRGDLKQGYFATVVKVIIIFAALAGLTSLALRALGIID
jgi:hypothetical protein